MSVLCTCRSAARFCSMRATAGRIYKRERRFKSCHATVTMSTTPNAWRHGSSSTTRALYVDLSCQRMTWRMRTRKSGTKGRQKTGRALPMLCLTLTFCIHDARASLKDRLSVYNVVMTVANCRPFLVSPVKHRQLCHPVS